MQACDNTLWTVPEKSKGPTLTPLGVEGTGSDPTSAEQATVLCPQDPRGPGLRGSRRWCHPSHPCSARPRCAGLSAPFFVSLSQGNFAKPWCKHQLSGTAHPSACRLLAISSLPSERRDTKHLCDCLLLFSFPRPPRLQREEGHCTRERWTLPAAELDACEISQLTRDTGPVSWPAATIGRLVSGSCFSEQGSS